MAIQPKNTNDIRVDIIGEKAAAAGVTIDGVLLKDSLVQGNACDFSVSVRGANNTYLRARNAANSADLSLIKADASDNIRHNAGTGKQIDFSINDVVKTSFNSSGNLVPAADGGQDIGSTALQFGSIFGRNVTRTSAGALTITCTDGALVINTQGAAQEIQLATQGTNRWRIDSSRLFPNANNSVDIGISSTQEVRSIYCATSLTRGSAGNLLVSAASGTLTLSGSASVDLAISGSARHGVDSAGHFKPAADNTYDIGSTLLRPRVVHGVTVKTERLTNNAGTLSPVLGIAGGNCEIQAGSTTLIINNIEVTDASTTATNEYLQVTVDGVNKLIRLYTA